MNYIINNNTIALIKDKNKTIMIDVDNCRVINKSICKIIRDNCELYGSNLTGRKEFVKKVLKIAYKIPIVINQNIILIQLNSIRSDNCLFIVANKVIDYNYTNNRLLIKCVENIILFNNISKNSFEKLLLNTTKLNNLLKWQKNVNFV